MAKLRKLPTKMDAHQRKANREQIEMKEATVKYLKLLIRTKRGEIYKLQTRRKNVESEIKLLKRRK